MNKFYTNLLFSIIVTAVMNALDMVYHLATGWAVHLNYVAIKITVIFLTVWMITQFIGKGKEEGIIASIFGPLMFYVYYVFVGATLNREIFKLDEQFWFIFLHIAFMLIAYFSALYFVKAKKHLTRTLNFLLITSFTAIALDALFIMIGWRLLGIDEETAASLMTFSLILVPVLGYILGVAIGILTEHYTNERYFDRVIAGIIAAIIIWLSSKDIMHVIVAFVIINIAYYGIHNYKKNLAVEAS